MTPKYPIRTFVAALLLGSLLASFPQPARACGPFFTDTIFVYTKHPDFPLEQFAAGRLGVLQASYARSYLVAAYRNLIGAKLTATESAGIKEVWNDRLNSSWESNDSEWTRKWNAARAKAPGAGKIAEIQVYRNREKPHEYETYLNCQQDAFENAEGALSERIKRFGADSNAVRDWLKAQDVVFSNCGGGQQIPEAAAADADSSIRADRAYQIAAANFYSAQFDNAAKQFDAIASDNSSPWKQMAPYLAARSLLRKGSLAEKEDEGRASLADAETRLQAILKNNSLSGSHHAAGRLLNLVRLRLHPEDKLHELSQAIVKPGSSEDFKQAIWDYTVLLDKIVIDTDEVNTSKVAASLKSDDLTDWVLTFQDEWDGAAAHAVERWEKTGRLPWLVAAITRATGRSAAANDLIAAALRIDRKSPAYASAVFNAVRLLMETNRADEARTRLDGVLADRADLAPSAVNMLLGQRMMLSISLNQFLETAQRTPAGFSDNNDGREIPEDEKDAESSANGAKLFFDVDAANVFNKAMPVATMKEAGQSTILASNLLRDVRQAAFMRASLVDDRNSANQAAAGLLKAYPQLKELVAAYQQAATPDARRFASAYLALKFPGLRPYVTAGVGRSSALEEIDSFRDNWWCAEPTTVASTDQGDPAKVSPALVPQVLKSSQAVAQRELSALHALGTGPNYLCRIAIEWATKNPSDARAPEALHLAVKSTRYGCTDTETGRWSKAAFDLLHRRFASTSWAKETKYWFKG